MNLSKSSSVDLFRWSSILLALTLSPALVACDSSGETGGMDSGTVQDGGGDGGMEDGGINDAGPTDAGPNGEPSTTYPAPHPSMPQVVTLGGPVLANPKFVPVTFANDDATFPPALEDFLNRVGGTAYFASNTSEYGVGPASALATVASSESAAAQLDDTDVQAWLAGKLNADDPGFPVPDIDTLYVLIYPAATTITLNGATQHSCQDFGSYHSDVALDAAHSNLKVPYVVLPRCSDYGNLTGVPAATAALSSALLNAVTDPEPLDAPAFAQTDTDHIAWTFAFGGGEICSLCAQESSSFGTLSEIPYTAQRCWSNQSAAAGHDPCAPAPAGVAYFNGLPVLPDTLDVGNGVMTEAVRIAAGTSRTLAVDLFSDAATAGPMSVAALDYGSLIGMPTRLTLSLDTPTGLNGQHLNLTITVPQALATPALFVVSATVGGVTHFSVGTVGN